MPDLVKIGAYRIARCGFFGRGKADADFGTLAETMPALAEWLSHKQLRESCPVADHSQDGADHHPLLCCDFAERAGDYLFQMWDQSGSDQGGLASIPGEAVVGQAVSTEMQVAPGGVTGVGRLFWIIPELRILCTVRVRSGPVARTQFEAYLRSYLRNCSPWAVTEEGEDGSLSVIAYAPPGSTETGKVRPVFSLDLLPDLSRVEEIRRRRADIQEVHYHGDLAIGQARSTLNDATGVLGQVMGLFSHLRHFAPDDRRPAKVKLHVRIPYTPTVDELDELIAQVSGNSGLEPSRVGFRMSQDEAIVWIDTKRIAEEAEFEVPRVNRYQVRTGELLELLQRYFRARLERRVEAAEAA